MGWGGDGGREGRSRKMRGRRKEDDGKGKKMSPWVRSQENMALRPGQLELRSAQMKRIK